MAKTYAIVEINCGYTSTDIVGTGNCEAIVINWDLIVDERSEAMESLKRVRMAKDNMASQSMTQSQYFLESIESRLMDVMDGFEEITITRHGRTAAEGPEATEEEELCSDCGKQVDGCECDDNDDDDESTLPVDRCALSSTADAWGCDSMVEGAPYAGGKAENNASSD